MTDRIYFAITRKRTDAQIVAVKIPKYHDRWHLFPNELKPSILHTVLSAIPSAVGAVNAIPLEQPIDDISVLLSSELEKAYTDDQHNFVFLNKYLIKDSNRSIDRMLNSEEENEFKERIEQLEKKIRDSQTKEDERLKDIEKRMIVDEFNGKTNANDWMNQFESECARLGVRDAKGKIKSLSVFMKEAANDWCTVARKKVDLDDWNAWKTSFADSFGITNWQTACAAVQYRYQNGPLTDYALKKQRLCINEDPNMTEATLIILIIAGLPPNIRSRIDRPKITSMSELIKNLAGLYNENLSGKDYERNRTSNRPIKSFERNSDKKPTSETNGQECGVCAALGRHGRKHSAEKCWNRDKVKQLTKQANLLNLDASEESEQIVPLN